MDTTTNSLDPRTSTARAIADLEDGLILACVELAATPERVFQALTSDQICTWWVRPGVFDTREWAAEMRPGGRWRAAGIGGGQPYALEGEFVEISSPRKLVQTWRTGADPAVTTFTFHLEPLDGGTHVTLCHVGFSVPRVCGATGIGWETSFVALEAMFARD